MRGRHRITPFSPSRAARRWRLRPAAASGPVTAPLRRARTAPGNPARYRSTLMSSSSFNSSLFVRDARRRYQPANADQILEAARQVVADPAGLAPARSLQQRSRIWAEPGPSRLAAGHPARYVFIAARQSGWHRSGRLCRAGRRGRPTLGPAIRWRRADHAAGHRRRTGRTGEPHRRRPHCHRRTRQRAGSHQPGRARDDPAQSRHPAHADQSPRPAGASDR